MKNILYTSILLVVFSCSNIENNSNSKTATIEEKKTEVAQDYFGAYISSEYLRELGEHGSTKNAQEKAIMSNAYFESNDGIVILSNTWSFHEGGGTDKVMMTTDTKAIVVGETSLDTIYKIIFSNNSVIIFDDKNRYELEKYDDNPKNKDCSNIINRTILSGEFFNEGNRITFNPNGEIIGNDSIKHYSFNTDYYDAGMDFDKIYLTFVNQNKPKAYGYRINTTEFEIFELKCEYFDPYVADFCMEHSMGKTIFNLKRKK